MISSIIQFHEHPKLLRHANSRLGRTAIWLTATALLIWHSKFTPWNYNDPLILMAAVLAVVMIIPEKRTHILAVSSLLAILDFVRQAELPALQLFNHQSWVAVQPTQWLRFALLSVAVAFVLYLFFVGLKLFDRLPAIVRKYPVIMFHLGVWLVLLTKPLGIVVKLLQIVLWRVSYLIQFTSRGKLPTTRFRDHIFYLWPVFGPINTAPTPFGKGFEYLKRHEAQGSAELTKSQLSGLKLLLLAALWVVVLKCMNVFIFGEQRGMLRSWVGSWTIDFPRLHDIMDNNLTDFLLVTTSVYLEFIYIALHIAVFGHVIVGCIRLLGFQVYRHMYAPMLATSIVDFWNRWTYYFKELLTEFFFYPTFTRCSWASPKVRLFLAVFAAACVGNMYFVMMWEVNYMLDFNLDKIWTSWGSRTVYCFLLALGIWISMLRQQRIRRNEQAELGIWLHARKSFLVCSFYAIVHIWNVSESNLGPIERVQWLGGVIF